MENPSRGTAESFTIAQRQQCCDDHLSLGSILLMLRYRPPPKDAASILYQKFTKKVGIPPSRGETPLSYAVRLAREQAGLAGHADSITVQYLDARYGPHDLLALEKLKVSVSEFSRRS